MIRFGSAGVHLLHGMSYPIAAQVLLSFTNLIISLFISLFNQVKEYRPSNYDEYKEDQPTSNTSHSPSFEKGVIFKNKCCWLKTISSILSLLVNQVMKGLFLMVILSVSQVFNYSLHHCIVLQDPLCSNSPLIQMGRGIGSVGRSWPEPWERI